MEGIYRRDTRICDKSGIREDHLSIADPTGLGARCERLAIGRCQELLCEAMFLLRQVDLSKV